MRLRHWVLCLGDCDKDSRCSPFIIPASLNRFVSHAERRAHDALIFYRPKPQRLAINRLLIWTWLLLMLMVITPGCATLTMDDADTAQLADTATTGVGISAGLQEANPVMAPLVHGGPIGLFAMAGIKLGFNKLGRHQEPKTCRDWLSISSAAGWGAAVSNITMMTAPPLAIVALPIAIQTYRITHDNTALKDCYQGMLADAILQVPENTRLEDMPEDMRHAMLDVVGMWPRSEIMPGTHPVNNRKLIQIVTIDHWHKLQGFIAEYDLDWRVIGVKQRGGDELLPLKTAQVIPHLKTSNQSVINDESNSRFGANLNTSTGTLTICHLHACIWKIQLETQVASNLVE